MIAEMTSVLIVGRNRDALEVTRALQNVGVVQFDPLESKDLPRGALNAVDAERRAVLERLVARAESIVAALGGATPTSGRQANRPPLPTNREEYLNELGRRVDVLSAERETLEGEIEAVGAYGRVTRELAALAGTLGASGRLSALPVLLSADEDPARLRAQLDEGLPGRFAVGVRALDAKTGVAVLAVRRSDEGAARAAVSRAGLAELRLPGRFAGHSLVDAARLVDERNRTAPEELQGVHEELSRLRQEHFDAVNVLRLELRDELSRYITLEAAGKGRYGFALRGWLPVDSRPALEAALKPLASQLVYAFEAPDPHHSGPVPVKLKNNAFVRPFELFLGIFAPPGYGTFDPTWVIATFFPIFFGFVIGDVGFGVLFLVLAYWMSNLAKARRTLNISFMSMRVPPVTERALSIILTHMGAWSIVFGVIYGELFGTLGEHLHLFRTAHEGGLIPILLPRLDTSTAGVMMLLALAPGIFQVLYGWYVRFSLGVKHQDRRHIFEGLGMFIGLVGLIIMAYAYRNPGSPVWLYYIGGVCLVAFAVCVVLSGVYMMFIEILSNGGNILSYLRLYAVGLSSAVLAQLSTDLGWSLGGHLGILGILIGIIVGLLVHVFAITFTIIGHVLQPLRLHYAEFFTKFGFFESSGRPYRPFARLGGHEVAGR